MTTSKYDLAYGRQGGRIMPWRDRSSAFHVGQLVRIVDPDLNRRGDDVVVVAIPSGQRVTVNYGDVKDFTIPATMIEPVLPRFRPSDGHTSEDAARSFTVEKLTAARLTVLTALVNAGRNGLTDFELESRTGVKQTSHGKRRGELRDHGLVEWSGLTRPSDTGTQAKVWRVTDLGIRVWREQIGGAA